MFIIGSTFFTAGKCFDCNLPLGNINQIDCKNAKFDELKVDSGTNTQTYQPQKQSWEKNTVFNCKFEDLNFEAGSVRLAGIPVEYLRIKKRKSGDLTWQTYKDLPYNSSQIDYNWSDYFVESLVTYDYAIFPVGGSIEGEYSINTIDCEYDDIFILGANNVQYKLLANIQKGEVQTVSPSTFVETLGSKYPYEIQNGSINYRKGTCKATLVSDSTLNGNGIDRKSERELRNNLYSFLTNKKPKIYKDSDGDYILASIKTDSVKITPNNDLSRQIADLTFDFYEISDATSVQALQDCALLV